MTRSANITRNVQSHRTAPFSRRSFMIGATLSACAIVMVPAPATAQSLNNLRASGAVGERFDGFLQARSKDGKARSVVKDVNAKRRKIYSRRAAEQGVSADQVGRVYAQQIFKKAPSGTYFLQANGKWIQK